MTAAREELDVVVVGAGPAGCAAAITAVREGLRVLVVDKATFPRDKTCGDGLTTAALRDLERLGLSLGVLPSAMPVHETVLVSPSGRRVTLPMPGGGLHTVVVPRLELDAALVALARSVGVDVHDGVALEGLVDGDPAVARLSNGFTVRTRWVIAADGQYSPTRRALGVRSGPELGTWHAVRQYFSGVDDARLSVLFEADLLPGYAWVFPLPDGRANVGFGVLRDGRARGKGLRALWPDVLARASMREALGPRACPEGAHRAWPIPSVYDPARLAAGPALFAGDAASVVDPLTGEGIAQALETGMLAATSIARAGSRPTVRARYVSLVDRALGRDLRFAGRLQRLLRSPLGARASIRAAGLTPWTRRNFARWMYEDYPRALILTPDRWGPRMFTPPGAYGSSS